MQAVIMAGGKGTRLHPYTATFPKPLMPLGDMPILEVLLHRLRKAGVTDIILAVNHLSHLIEAFVGDGSKFGVKVRYSNEDHALGTAGALASMIDLLDDSFFVMNGDLLTTLSMENMAAAHAEWKADASVGVYERELKIDFGLIERDSENRLVSYREKPTSSCFVSMGIYMLRREAIRPYLELNKYLDMPTLLLRLQAAAADVRCYHEDCFWLDIGRPDDFAKAQDLFEEDRGLFLDQPTGVKSYVTPNIAVLKVGAANATVPVSDTPVAANEETTRLELSGS